MSSETPPDERVVLLFASIHDVLAAEALAKERGLWCDMVPAPRELSSDCGMVLELGGEGWEQVRALLGERDQLRGVFRLTASGYEQIWPSAGA